MQQKQTPFFILTVALFLVIISPNLLSDGMFMDGILYAAVSKNLANGSGNFWHLHLTNTLYPDFHEHPPLMFGLQSLCFKLFGQNLYVERIYSVATFFITGFVLIKIWNNIVKETHTTISWLPLLLIVSIPLMTWAASNNILENTMMIFTSLSVLFTLKSFENNRVIYLSLSGLSLFLAFLTKGFTGLYPLSFIFWMYVVQSEIHLKRFLTDTILLLIFTLLPFVLLFVYIPESIESILQYLNKQVAGSLQNVVTVDSRFFIIEKLFMELLPMLIIYFLFNLITRKIKLENPYKKTAFVFFLLALSGVLPIMISMKQRGFYILTTFPFFAIGVALLMVPKIEYMMNRINIQSNKFKIFKNSCLALLGISLILVFANANRIGRDKDTIEDVYSLIKTIPENSTISIQPEMYEDWALHGYFHRYGEISMDPKTPFGHKYVLVKKGWENEELLHLKRTSLELYSFDLYERE